VLRNSVISRTSNGRVSRVVARTSAGSPAGRPARATALAIAGERATDLGRDLAELRESWLERADRPGARSTARRLIDGLPGQPIVLVESASALFDVSDEAARVALNRLERTGVLRLVTVGKRNRAWAATEVFELLDEFDTAVGARTR